jgi:hypothetical protein
LPGKSPIREDHGLIQVLIQGYFASFERRDHQLMPSLKFLGIQLEVGYGRCPFALIPGIGEQYAAQVEKDGSDIGQGSSPRLP